MSKARFCFTTAIILLTAASLSALLPAGAKAQHFTGNQAVFQALIGNEAPELSLATELTSRDIAAWLPEAEGAGAQPQQPVLRYKPEADQAWHELGLHLRQRTAAETGQVSGAPRGFMRTIAETPGLAFLSSAIVPGLGQAANQQWWKTAVFAGIEIGAVYLMVDQRRIGNRKQQQYNDFADAHWSVVQYAQFLVQYTQLDMRLEDVLTPAGLQVLRDNGFVRATFNTDIDWAMIDLARLNEFEFGTLSRLTGRPLSHVVNPYGSQQYYELPSKYFQFAPGWRDWNRDISIIDGGVADMPPSWRFHAALEEEFNDALRFSRSMGLLLIANHVFSAFDAFFVSQMRMHRRQLETTASLSAGGSPSVQLSFKF